jgi:hypothetical protein
MSADIKLIEVTQICIRVRDAIEKLKRKSFPLKEFPQGCCRDTTLILSMVLLEYGFENTHYCSKDLDNEIPSPAWLEYEGYILDLTADQFGPLYPPVLTVNCILPTPIHRRDNIQQPG